MTALHIRVDSNELNSQRTFACGLGPELPAGDKYLFADEEHKAGAYFATHKEMAECPGCFPLGKPQFGTPLSKLSGRPGHDGYAQFQAIAKSWGYD